MYRMQGLWIHCCTIEESSLNYRGISTDKNGVLIVPTPSDLGGHLLSVLTPGQTGLVRSLHAVEGFAQRLAALGFRIGRPVTVVRCAPMGGPIQVRVGTTDVMLRRAEASRIEVAITP